MLHYGTPQPNGIPKPSRESAIQWARDLMASPNHWVILDTETTGLRSHDQVIQIGVLGGYGNVLIDNQLIRPTCDMSAEAQGVHGISLEQLKDAPTYLEYLPTLREILSGRIIVIFNAAFDTRILAQTARDVTRSTDPWNYKFGIEVQCAMIEYSHYKGEFSNSKLRWQKLPSGSHNALADCYAVYNIIKEMAEVT